MHDFLKKIPLFSDLAEDDLNRLCDMVEEVQLKAGEVLFTEGSPGDYAYVIKEGEIEILKASGGRDVLLAVRKPGDVIGEMSILESAPRFATVRARKDSLLLAIGHSQLQRLLDTSSSAVRSLLHTITSRLRSTELMLRQSEKMAQLGTMTAGIAHELNNPASAAQRGASQLIAAINQLQQANLRLGKLALSPEKWEILLELETLVRVSAASPEAGDPLARSDREFQMETWLADRNIDNAWEFAPVLADLGFGDEQLDRLAENFPSAQLSDVIAWLGASFTVYSLLAEISQGASRISEIVKSLKTYAYLDQAPVQAVDLHEGIDHTLVLLRHKLKQGVNVRREFGEGIPKIQAYGSELNQVWTNIIDNAIDAMDGKGDIWIRTRKDGDWVIVEIEDNGPGISQEIQDRIFSPFFTTKAVGKGTGLGLYITYDIIQKHAGEIKLYSQPGKTRFRICLPIDFEKVQTNNNPVPTMNIIDDEKLLSILSSVKNLAVVGISSNKDQPNHSVPAYLQAKGYKIIPVNPNLDEVLGEKAYPDLSAIPESVDLVLVFRRSEFVPEIVDQAIGIGAKVVWMQEGIFNELAAAAAREAGLIVVMDTCMRATHKRLMGGS